MIHRALLVVTLAAGAVVPAAAQVLGMPVVNNGAPTGINIGADVAFANDAYFGGGTGVGAHATVGLGFFAVTGAVSHFSPKSGDGVLAPGAAATLRLLGGPLVPFRITLQAGASQWTVSGVQTTHVPISLGLSATIPNPAFGLKPWIAPRYEVFHGSGNGTTHTDWDFGISGGIDLSLLSGLMIRAVYDRASINDTHPGIFSLGLGFAL